MTCAACSTTAGPTARDLPAASLVVPEPVARPSVRVGDDARLLALRALLYGDQNAARLRQARDAYEAVRDAASRPAGIR